MHTLVNKLSLMLCTVLIYGSLLFGLNLNAFNTQDSILKSIAEASVGSSNNGIKDVTVEAAEDARDRLLELKKEALAEGERADKLFAFLTKLSPTQPSISQDSSSSSLESRLRAEEEYTQILEAYKPVLLLGIDVLSNRLVMAFEVVHEADREFTVAVLKLAINPSSLGVKAAMNKMVLQSTIYEKHKTQLFELNNELEIAINEYNHLYNAYLKRQEIPEKLAMRSFKSFIA